MDSMDQPRRIKLELRNKIPKTKEELAQIRKLNRDRAKRMERDITKKLNGKRTPMSGAGVIKGDGIVALPDNQGLCILECKVTSSLHEKHGPQIAFKLLWLTKLEEDTQAMRLLGSRFGALIIKFHNTSRMYVFIDTKYLPTVEQTLSIELPRVPERQLTITQWDNGRKRIIQQITELTLSTLVHGTLETLYGSFYIMTFSEFERMFKKDA
jgi:hypothetical protein